MFIDIHAHVARIKPRAFIKLCTPDELIEVYDRCKIDMGVLLPMVNAEIYLPQSVDDIIEIAENHSDRFIPYCNVDPRCLSNSPDAKLDTVLQAYKDAGCKGVGEVMPNMSIMDPLVQNLFKCTEKVGLPLVYDGSAQLTGDFGPYDEPGLPYLEWSLLAYPNLKIFGHGPVFWSEIGRLDRVASRAYYMVNHKQVCTMPSGPIEEEGAVPKLMRLYQNLHGDLSDPTAFNAIARDDKYGPRFLSEFEDRLYYGTDIIGPSFKDPLGPLLISWREQGKISETTFRKIARENAEKLLEIK